MATARTPNKQNENYILSDDIFANKEGYDSSQNRDKNLASHDSSDRNAGNNAPSQEIIYTVNRPQLPRFFKDQPDIWLMIAEAEFTSAKTRSDDVKFNTIIRALDVDTLRQVTDILDNPPTGAKYQTLKQALIQRFSDSRQKQLHKLLKEMVLGDRKPSQLLREMRNLAAGVLSDEIFQQLWLDRLPMHIKPLLVTSTSVDLTNLAELACSLLDLGCGG